MKLEIKKKGDKFVVQDETEAVYGTASTKADADQLLKDWKEYYAG